MSGATALAIGWLQRALRHEFSAARQFALQAVQARRLGDAALAADFERSAGEELAHAQRFAHALAELGAPFGDGAAPPRPTGRTLVELLVHACETEAAAVRLYRDAARRCAGAVAIRRLFEAIGAEEAAHLEDFERRLRALSDRAPGRSRDRLENGILI
jgi:bacterioferritin